MNIIERIKKAKSWVGNLFPYSDKVAHFLGASGLVWALHKFVSIEDQFAFVAAFMVVWGIEVADRELGTGHPSLGDYIMGILGALTVFLS